MKYAAIATAIALSFCTMAFAHDEKGPHGGVAEHAGAYHVELVAKGKSVEVFVLDGALKPIDHTGQKGFAILIVGGKSVRIQLAATGTDRLTGTAPSEIKGGAQGRGADRPAIRLDGASKILYFVRCSKTKDIDLRGRGGSSGGQSCKRIRLAYR